MYSRLYDIFREEFSNQMIDENIKNHVNLFNSSMDYILKLPNDALNNRVCAYEMLNKITKSINAIDYLLLDANPMIPRQLYIDSLFNQGTLLKNICEDLIKSKMSEMKINNTNRKNPNNEIILDNLEKELFNKSLQLFFTILHVDFENELAIKQIVSVYTQLVYLSQNDVDLCLEYLTHALFYSPTNPTLHYNLAYIYKRKNVLDLTIIHYKLSNKLINNNNDLNEIEGKRLYLNNFNGLANVYRSIKKWPECLYYLLKGYNIDNEDPDINNQLGVAYTELRETELGEKHYKLAILHYKKTFISTDSKFLLSEIYLNYGHMHSYNGDNYASVECYNKALLNIPKFHLAYQNKIMNLNYIFDQLEDPMYITNQHKLINKIINKNANPYDFNRLRNEKINIGIVSGDFINHPVSYFISVYLKNFNHEKFNLTCYSECLIDANLFNKHINVKIIKNMSQKEASDIIYNDNIDILLDLAGHTGFNRIDIFAYKPAPIQINYIGYPFTSGLNEMTYRITDNICDGDFSISQEYYTEKLIALPNCFLCYDPIEIECTKQEYLPLKNTIDNEYITIGCFNRLNKITDNVIVEFNNILSSNKKIKFVFKTKALINKRIKTKFLNKFDTSNIDRITILDSTLTHKEHLDTYNKVNIAIDTFPYSGTTTTCEALYMGVPVFSYYDTEFYFHPQNVSCSILKNSGLDFFICKNTNEIIDKIKQLDSNGEKYWNTLKENIRCQFLNGDVCNKQKYMTNIEQLFCSLIC